MKIDHIARAKKAWPLLVRRANDGGQPYTYGELCAKLNLHHRAAGWFLGVIQNYCDRNELPPLQALAVNKSTKLPGSGYTGSVNTKEGHERALKKVRAKEWDLAAPDLSPKPSAKRKASRRR